MPHFISPFVVKAKCLDLWGQLSCGGGGGIRVLTLPLCHLPVEIFCPTQTQPHFPFCLWCILTNDHFMFCVCKGWAWCSQATLQAAIKHLSFSRFDRTLFILRVLTCSQPCWLLLLQNYVFKFMLCWFHICSLKELIPKFKSKIGEPVTQCWPHSFPFCHFCCYEQPHLQKCNDNLLGSWFPYMWKQELLNCKCNISICHMLILSSSNV